MTAPFNPADIARLRELVERLAPEAPLSSDYQDAQLRICSLLISDRAVALRSLLDQLDAQAAEIERWRSDWKLIAADEAVWYTLSDIFGVEGMTNAAGVVSGVTEKWNERQARVAELEAEIERLRAELAVERQCRNGHLPDCAGIDFEQMRCGCGYLDGTAYRSLADEIERLKAECIREHARAFAPFCEQSERADKAEARVKGLERELACLSEHAPPGHPLHSCGGPQEACMQPGCTECGTPTMEEALAMRARVAELEGLLRKHAALACSACAGTGCYLGDEDRDGPCDVCAGTGAVLPADVVVAIGGGGR